MTTSADSTAVQNLADALVIAPRTPSDLGRWRWMVRQRMVGVRNALTELPTSPDDGSLAPRHGASQRERVELLGRLSTLGPKVLEDDDLEPVREDLQRLVGDIRHHLQRRRDIVWDDVQQEFGGSE